MRKLGKGRMHHWGILCPTDENHGPLLALYDSKTEDAWICPHAGHSRSSPPTKSTFTDREADGNSLAVEGIPSTSRTTRKPRTTGSRPDTARA